jgi:hypothetical protein
MSTGNSSCSDMESFLETSRLMAGSSPLESPGFTSVNGHFYNNGHIDEKPVLMGPGSSNGAKNQCVSSRGDLLLMPVPAKYRLNGPAASTFLTGNKGSSQIANGTQMNKGGLRNGASHNGGLKEVGNGSPSSSHHLARDGDVKSQRECMRRLVLVCKLCQSRMQAIVDLLLLTE